jgi:hypothetical protein
MPSPSSSRLADSGILPGLVAPVDPRGMWTNLIWTANRALGVRCLVPATGRLRDVAIYVKVQNGNVDVGVYNTAEPRARLWSSGSIACPAAGGWRIIGDPDLPVQAGTMVDLVLASDSATFDVAVAVMQSFNVALLPTGFIPGDGGLPRISWLSTGAQFPLPATIAEAAATVVSATPAIIARIS